MGRTYSPFEKEFMAVARRRLPEGAKTTPSGSATAVLALLADRVDGLSGSEIARRIGHGQANTTNLTLPRLQEMGLVEYDVIPNDHGGRPAHIWRLTQKGRDLGILASVESRSAAGIHSSERNRPMPNLHRKSRGTAGSTRRGRAAG